jgi:UDP-glucose 4-epimerase
MKLLPKRVLVTGGAGFIGSHLVDLLAKQARHVSVLDNLSTGSLDNLSKDDSVKFVKGDVTDPSAVGGVMANVDAVVHLAAILDHELCLRNPELANQVNANGTLTVLEEARKRDVKRFVLASSAAVYGNATKLPITEDSKLEPLTPYGESKLAAEQHCLDYARQYGLSTVCLRYFNVFGPRQTARQYSGVITEFMKNLRHNKPPIIDGDGLQTRDFVSVEDVTNATVLALDTETASGVYNIATGVETTIQNLAKILVSITGRTSTPIYAPARSGDIGRSVGDIYRARKQLGYSPTTNLDEDLRNLWNWYLST